MTIHQHEGTQEEIQNGYFKSENGYEKYLVHASEALTSFMSDQRTYIVAKGENRYGESTYRVFAFVPFKEDEVICAVISYIYEESEKKVSSRVHACKFLADLAQYYSVSHLEDHPMSWIRNIHSHLRLLFITGNIDWISDSCLR